MVPILTPREAAADLNRASQLLTWWRMRDARPYWEASPYEFAVELRALVGDLPRSNQEARTWARNLRELARECEAEPDPEASLGASP